jgi:hypothetical protein
MLVRSFVIPSAVLIVTGTVRAAVPSGSLASRPRVAGVSAVARPQSAAVNPLRFGTWKLNLAKSVFTLGPAPAGQTQIYAQAGRGIRATVETVADGGVRIQYSYTANLDGKEYPILGEFTPNGAETVALTAVDAFTIDATLRRTGAVVLTIRSVISTDGGELTLTSMGTNANEQPTNSVTVFERQ